MINQYIVSGQLVVDTEIEAVKLYFKGVHWSCSSDEIDTILCGYGELYSISFQYELPLWFRTEYNILGGCFTWEELHKKELRIKKLKRII